MTHSSARLAWRRPLHWDFFNHWPWEWEFYEWARWERGAARAAGKPLPLLPTRKPLHKKFDVFEDAVEYATDRYERQSRYP